ncbi:hypothetical protein CLF_113286 [Clonorchis sinensis]|uniref:Uncharacterized protein n=1 Tax=Clonorchis sinensis TaxID=79923 RepID=G7YY34_CLOSI|nr:hypothetical protein CLF_113286 [Clonorchis sinensis]
MTAHGRQDTDDGPVVTTFFALGYAGFPEDFEDIPEVAGLKTKRGTLAALNTIRRGPGRRSWMWAEGALGGWTGRRERTSCIGIRQTGQQPGGQELFQGGQDGTGMKPDDVIRPSVAAAGSCLVGTGTSVAPAVAV